MIQANNIRESACTYFNKDENKKVKEKASISTLLTAVKQCAKHRDLEKGKALHIYAVEAGCHTNKYVATALVNMFSKCGSMFQAREAFDKMIYRDAVSWNTLMVGYVENGECLEAMDLFALMDCEPDASTYVAAFKACMGLVTQQNSDKQFILQKVMSIHRQAKERGLDGDVFVATRLVDAYRKCGIMRNARAVFDQMAHRDVVLWTTLMMGYVENGESMAAVELFTKMDCEADCVAFVSVFMACASLGAEKQLDREVWLEKGLALHEQAKERGFDTNVYVGSTLVDMFRKCGSMMHAQAVFERMPSRNVVSWNNLILGYVENGESLVALELFLSMQCKPNAVSFVAAVKACIGLDIENRIEKGRNVHKQAEKYGFDTNVFVAAALVDMYGKYGNMVQARNVFDKATYRDAFLWTNLILGYVENGESNMAFDLFNTMNCEPNSFTFVAALKACVGLASEKQYCLHKGRAIHEQVKDHAVLFVANALVDMYRKLGSMSEAQGVFDKMPERDTVSWNSMIVGYVENGESLSAMNFFAAMDCEPDSITFVAALRACRNTGSLRAGEQLHTLICKLGLEQDEVVATCLVDFYGKCGNVVACEHFFNSMHSRDIVSWTALMAGYVSVGNTPQVFNTLNGMQQGGLQMDEVIFVSILTACSQAGMVAEGRMYFESMYRYNVVPSMAHYACMVEMLGKANRLHEALLLVKNMPYEANTVMWMTLLEACRNWSNLEVGAVAFGELLAHPHAYVLMSDIYNKLGMQQEWIQLEAQQRKATDD